MISQARSTAAYINRHYSHWLPSGFQMLYDDLINSAAHLEPLPCCEYADSHWGFKDGSVLRLGYASRFIRTLAIDSPNPYTVEYRLRASCCHPH